MSTAQLLAGDPIWLILIKVVGVFAFLMLLTLFLIWFERRVVGRMQHRPGPNWNGPFGLLQSLADGLKFPFKEDIRPVLADKWVYILAPVVSAIPAFTAFAVIPLGGEVTLFGHQTALQLVDLPVGVLVVLACSSMGVYGIVLAGWSSGSPYPLLGALRSAAQVISYEIAMGLSILAVVLYAGSLSTGDIVAAQDHSWFFYVLPVSFVVYVISMVGETNRAPFDLAEAESELVGGFHTEYSSFKFALFFLAEYINMVTVSALATTMFLGGWHSPFGAGTLDHGWWGLVWFFLKTMVLLFCFVWLRGTLPRFRYDQFMKLGWKVLVPVSLVWFVAISTLRTVRNTQELFIGLGIALVVLVIVSLLIPDREVVEETVPMADERGRAYPVPPLDLVVPSAPPRRPGRHRERRAVGQEGDGRTAVTAGVGGTDRTAGNPGDSSASGGTAGADTTAKEGSDGNA